MKSESHCPKGLGRDSISRNYSRFFSIFSSGGHFVYQSGTCFDRGSPKQLSNLAVMIEGHLSNFLSNLNKIGPVV